MKLAAVLLLAAASICLGFSRSAALRARCAALEGFSRIVSGCQHSIRYLSMEVIPILESLQDAGPLTEFIAQCLHLCKNMDFHAAYRQAMQVLPRELTQQDRAMIAEFGDRLGKSDLTGQLSLCTMTDEKCREYLKNAKADAASLSSLYIHLGAMGGIAAAVIIL